VVGCSSAFEQWSKIIFIGANNILQISPMSIVWLERRGVKRQGRGLPGRMTVSNNVELRMFQVHANQSSFSRLYMITLPRVYVAPCSVDLICIPLLFCVHVKIYPNSTIAPIVPIWSTVELIKRVIVSRGTAVENIAILRRWKSFRHFLLDDHRSKE
jgi:stage V sporulation protein SpoVS